MTQLKSLKPSGLFAHDLRECLLYQLMENHPENELALRLTDPFGRLWPAAADRFTAGLCTAAKHSFMKPWLCLRSCDPKPGRSQGTPAAPLVCEVQVEIEEEQFKITLTRSFSELVFNPMPLDDPSVQDYLKQKH